MCRKCENRKFRNAFLNFLNEYRCNHGKNSLSKNIVKDAAKLWRTMSKEEKSKYKCEAENAEYVYYSKNKNLNNILKTLRNTFPTPYEIHGEQLKKVLSDIQDWKEEVLEKIW